jgi:tetratricopeptide (TPR) repeat protein
MSRATNSSAPVGSLASRLRRQWEAGEHAATLRAALANWDALLRDDDLHWLQEGLRRYGLGPEAFAVQLTLARRQSPAESAWETLIDSVVQSGDVWWAKDLLRESGTPSRKLQALQVEVDLALGDAAAAISAWLADRQDTAAREVAVHWWIRAGRVEEAERLLAESGGSAADSSVILLWRARLALWRRQTDAARQWLAQLAPSPQSRCLEGIALALEDRLDEAAGVLEGLRQSEAQVEALSWLAAVYRKQGRLEQAIQAANQANIAGTGFNLSAHLEKELGSEFQRVGIYDGHRMSPFLSMLHYLRLWPVRRKRTISELEYAELLRPLGLKPWNTIGTLAFLMERFAGNRTPDLTTYDDGQLVSHRLPVDPRHLGATIQRVLWTRGAEGVRAVYRQLAASVGGHPLYLIYQGEVELWLGHYEEAAQIFREAIGKHRKTRWAWIGLGASEMLRGNLLQAQKTWKKGLKLSGFAGPTLYVYRGECYRRQGQLDLARADLETALRQKPQRLSARINLALLDERPADLERMVQECTAFAPLLMQELKGSAAARLEGVLQAMRGNRTSSEWLVSYHLWGRVWRRGAP